MEKPYSKGKTVSFQLLSPFTELVSSGAYVMQNNDIEVKGTEEETYCMIPIKF